MNSKEAIEIAKKMLKDNKINTNQEYLETIKFMISLVDKELINNDISKITSEYSNRNIPELIEVDRSFGFKHGKRKILK